MKRILIVDHQRCVRNVLREKLEYEGYKAEVAGTLQEACEKHRSEPCDIVICEDKLVNPYAVSMNRELFGHVPPIILSDSPLTQDVAEEIKEKAFDFIPKPIDMNYLLASVRNVVDYIDDGLKKKEYEDRHLNEPDTDEAEMEEEEEEVEVEVEEEETVITESGELVAVKRRRRRRIIVQSEDIVGNSLSINHVKSLIDKVAPSDTKVLVTGANGTGKELVARWLHKKSNRCRGPFIEVNCAAIPSELIESELFGHEKGAFTSAVKQQKGKFEQADGGTLFLDEIGDMSASAQAKILRVLQENRICRVGSDKDIEVNVRVIAATNKNLREEIKKGNFREDLFHRLSVIVIKVPPLADRIEDIPLLTNYFFKKICKGYKIPTKRIEKKAVKELMAMEWTGNIRELRNVVERLIILGGDMITVDDIRTYAADII